MIDLRSDTVTQPSPAMRKAMAEARVGDDVLREDPTIIALQEKAAEITGMEAALFTPSGTFANQLAIFTWVPPGGEVYLSETTHIVQHEAGAPAVISAALLRPFIPASAPWTEWDDLAPRIRTEKNIHFPPSALICLENALSTGTAQPLSSMARIKTEAGKAAIPVHTDAARLFNAAAALNETPAAIAAQTNSLMFCLSKGLGAPVGSLLCGPADFIEEALFKRKIMGGGMRQAGILAAAGLVALQEELPRLPEDHENARLLSDAFRRQDERFEVITPEPAINMVFLKLRGSTPQKEQRFLQQLKDNGILTYPPEGGVFRFVTHRDVSRSDINRVISVLQKQ